MTLGERIKKLRKSLDLTQQTFAERIGISRNNIATYETGKSNPGEAVISLVCREFNVNENWLRNGEGDMFAKAPDNALEALAAEYNLDKFAQSVIQKIACLKPAQWDAVSSFVTQLADIFSKMDDKTDYELVPQTPPKPEPAATKNDSLSEIEELKRQNRELQEQIKRQSEDFAELRKELETMKQDDAYMGELSALLFSTPESLDTEKAKELSKQKNARQ